MNESSEIQRNLEEKYFFLDTHLIREWGVGLYPPFTKEDEKITLYVSDVHSLDPEDKKNKNIESFIKRALDDGIQDEDEPRKFKINDNLTIIFREPTPDEKKLQKIEALAKYESRKLYLLIDGYNKVSKEIKFEQRLKKNLDLGLVEQTVSDKQYDLIKENEFIPLNDLDTNIPEITFINQFLKISSSNSNLDQICKLTKMDKTTYIKNIFYGQNLETQHKSINKDFYNLKIDTIEQYLTMYEILLNRDIDLAFITGMAGAGKSQLTLASIIYQIMRSKQKDANGKDILIGDQIKKPIYNPPFYDKFVLLTDRTVDELYDSSKDSSEKILLKKFEQERRSLFPELQTYVDLIDNVGIVEKSFKRFLIDKTEYVNEEQNLHLPNAPLCGNIDQYFKLQNPYSINGRTFMNSLIYLDNGHEFGKSKMREILGTVGEKSKLIITGDINQINSDEVKNEPLSEANGFIWAINKYLRSETSSVALMKLSKTMRSWNARFAYE
jgi:hypothetical protein